MKQGIPADAGVLRVAVHTSSGYLGSHLPYAVRDARHTLVHRGTCGSESRLPEGLYSVVVITPDGRRETQVVNVRPRETTSAVFDQPSAEPADAAAADPDSRSVDAPNAPAFRGAESDAAGKDVVTLVSVSQCQVASADASGWEFVPAEPLEAVPSALFGVRGRLWKHSLPLSPRGAEYPLNACRVDRLSDGSRTSIRMSFAPERKLAALVNGLVQHREMTSAATLLRDATDLLMQYADPPAAVLGALTLHRLHLLEAQEGRIQGLAREHPWLPDAQILAAAQLRGAADVSARDSGLQLLLRAAGRRPMYVDALSLEMQLLRHWPDDHAVDERHRALSRLADYTAYADWDAVNLCFRLRDSHA